MTREEIQKKWDSFIEYPEGSDGRYVTTASALIFARVIAEMATNAEREACAQVCEEHPEGLNMMGGHFVLCAAAIRARGQA